MEKLINLEEKNLYDFIMNLNFYYKLQELILRIQQEKLIAEGVF